MEKRLKPVFVHAYIRFRFGRIEYVRKHWRSLPIRWPAQRNIGTPDVKGGSSSLLHSNFQNQCSHLTKIAVIGKIILVHRLLLINCSQLVFTRYERSAHDLCSTICFNSCNSLVGCFCCHLLPETPPVKKRYKNVA